MSKTAPSFSSSSSTVGTADSGKVGSMGAASKLGISTPLTFDISGAVGMVVIFFDVSVN